jgi:hypothetical protein
LQQAGLSADNALEYEEYAGLLIAYAVAAISLWGSGVSSTAGIVLLLLKKPGSGAAEARPRLPQVEENN